MLPYAMILFSLFFSLIRNISRAVFGIWQYVVQILHRHRDVTGTASCHCYAGVGQVTETNQGKGTSSCPNMNMRVENGK
ncbi:hypothetical protein GGU11DRAFT_790750 [Lentinula aff. detonsa]|nr:hypothetical protein GGU11DRAFT_790750 [Lentinula aff. detonsa]